jgi:DNA-binding XRE family transcriptional regulator
MSATSKRNPLIAWRERLGLTQTAAAEALGCGRRSLQAWENERADQIPLYILLACAALERKVKPAK